MSSQDDKAQQGPPSTFLGDVVELEGLKNKKSKPGNSKLAFIEEKRKERKAEKDIEKRKRKRKKQMYRESSKYKRTEAVSLLSKKEKEKKLMARMEKATRKDKLAAVQAAQAEILLTENAGFLEAEGMERTYKFSQDEISTHVDESTAKKMFSLKLDKFGPYATRYTRNGRHLLLGGRKGHVAAFDWQTGQLACELHLMETVRDITWLHNESMFAVAQKRHVYLYNHQGTEINYLNQHIDPLALDFLPHHFLLVSIGNSGFLKYHDVSIGKLVTEMRTKLGACNIMRQNPNNAVMHLGHTNGTVTLWTPNMREPVVKMLCHRSPVAALAVKSCGNVMATAGVDGQMKIWDIRNFKDKPIQAYFTPSTASYIDFSQRSCLAVSFGSHVQIWKDAHIRKQKAPYMYHHIPGSLIRDCRFAPFEDVLGIGHKNGMDSILVPGSGEPNYDAYEANPYEEKKQKSEREVRQLLDKVPSELISLNPGDVLRADTGSIAHKLETADFKEAKEKFEPRNRKRGKSSAQRRYLRKQKNIIDGTKLELQRKLAKEADLEEKKAKGGKRKALDRFAAK
eukprot:m.24476 g.24476  ORF g.24476 m.24476 type:complete len:567 (+) comp5657_c0_seq1:88-1788(+)